MDPYINILLLKNGTVVQKFALPRIEEITIIIGKQGSGADIEIPLDYVSRQHASLHCDGRGNLSIRDLGSTNGTYLNQQQIPSGQDIIVPSNTAIAFSDNSEYTLVATNMAEQSRPVTKPAATVAQPPVTSTATSTATSAPKQNKTEQSIFDLLQRQDSVIVGRHQQCDVVISDDTVSRQHMRIDRKSADKYTITDLDSTNGTFVNGVKLHGTGELFADDQILIGDFSLSLYGAARDIRDAMAIRAERIVKTYPNGYQGLHETSIKIPAQSLLAIMGPSGCGKSTLMKALTGDDPATGGRVYIHDLELAKNYEYLKPRIGYVPQDDIVHKELTVEQSLYYAAKLRMDNADDATINAKINTILADLGIVHIRHSAVGKISGGQRKRVSIAVELLTDPLILFMDEPTSPLDPQTIEEFLGILRRLSEKGTTVIMVTHKPEDLNYMDSVIFMAEGGHVVYFGSTGEYQSYFGVQHAVEVYAGISGDRSSAWINKYKTQFESKNVAPQDHSGAKPRKLKTSAVMQYIWLTRRYLKIKINDRINTAILLAQSPIIALLICFIFDDIAPALPFLIAISAIWFGASNAAREIVGELPIYRRERMFNLLIPPYILSKLTVLSLFAAVQALVFILIISLRYSPTLSTNIDPAWMHPLASALWMLFLSAAATLMGLLLSAAANTSEKVMTLVPIVLIPQIILGGFIARISNWGVEFFSWLTLSRWGTEGLYVIQEKVFSEQTVVTNTIDAAGKVTTNTQAQSAPTDAITTLNSRYLESYRDGSLFGDLTNTLLLDSLFIIALAGIFFVLTWFLLRKNDPVKHLA